MKKLNLNGIWQYQRVEGTESGPASVPGDVYRDLLENRQIPDPFYRDNELDLQWIGDSDWTFSRDFEIGEEFLENRRIVLCCNGLDTLATISINSKTIASTDNMFRTWEFEVKDVLRPGTNSISIRFASAKRYIDERGKELLLPGANRNQGHIRKEHCNFGWDWGIKAVTCGIWRDIALLAYDTARIEDAAILQKHDTGSVRLEIACRLSRISGHSLTVRSQVLLEDEVIAEETVTSAEDRLGIGLDVPDPQLWWPNNMGDQNLYVVKVELLDESGRLLDECRKRIGLRTLRLDRHEDRWGESFQFVVNDIPFFAKGANWIPADGILARVGDKLYRHLLSASAKANMNMLRVWGGGIYEDDIFYEICDELGICVWQDFMFACSHYPVHDDQFMATVREEARDNVRRLRHHACMALWCGNNELEQMNIPNAEKMGGWEGYGKLFDELLREVVAELDPERDYWPSSPHSPCGDRNDHNNPTCGDAHLWNVWHGGKPFEWYRTCEHRFNSEFGFQSFPEPKTVYGYTEEGDRNITSWVMEHHQRSGIGNTTIMRYMLDWFRLPEGFENTLWASQILQGMAMKYACEHWRRSMPRGMGTLYWQLNDTWPVASWSSIDYHGRWKALHYMARDFFAPILCSGLEDLGRNTVEIHVTSDRLEPIPLTAAWTVTDLAGRALEEGCVDVTAPACANSCVHELDLQHLVTDYGVRGLLVWLELRHAGADQSAAPVSSNLVLLSRPKHLELLDPHIVPTVERAGRGFKVTLTCEAPALWAWLELGDSDANFSSNFFHMLPGQPMEVEVVPEKAMSPADFKYQLRVRSLVDTYRPRPISCGENGLRSG